MLAFSLLVMETTAPLSQNQNLKVSDKGFLLLGLLLVSGPLIYYFFVEIVFVDSALYLWSVGTTRQTGLGVSI